MSRLSKNQIPNQNCSYTLNAQLSASVNCAGSSYTSPSSAIAQCYQCSPPYAFQQNATRQTTSSISSGTASIQGIMPISIQCCSGIALGQADVSNNALGLNFNETPVITTDNTTVSLSSCCTVGASENPNNPSATNSPTSLTQFAYSSSSSSSSYNFLISITRDHTGQISLTGGFGTPAGSIQFSMPLGTSWQTAWGTYTFTSSTGTTADGTNNALISGSITIAPAP